MIENLLSSAAQIFGIDWYLLSDLQKVFMFVREQYIKETKRFPK